MFPSDLWMFYLSPRKNIIFTTFLKQLHVTLFLSCTWLFFSWWNCRYNTYVWRKSLLTPFKCTTKKQSTLRFKKNQNLIKYIDDDTQKLHSFKTCWDQSWEVFILQVFVVIFTGRLIYTYSQDKWNTYEQQRQKRLMKTDFPPLRHRQLKFLDFSSWVGVW